MVSRNFWIVFISRPIIFLVNVIACPILGRFPCKGPLPFGLRPALVPGRRNGYNMLKSHITPGYSYSDLLDGNGSLLPYWDTFFASFTKLGPTAIQERKLLLQRFLKENGVTYNIYGDPSGQNRPWMLDMVPMLINKPEWQRIEAGLEQRAELFDCILKDIYGPQRLIKEGVLPLELVYHHPGFLRQCARLYGTTKKNEPLNALVLYSADLARTPDGNVWVINDRTQAPSGSGYALENRLAMSRMLPELFEGLPVKALNPYFDELRAALVRLAPGNAAFPRIVIMTPGPRNETYFEHSYLSSYLGFTLVQGDDLMVRNKYVWLKTIGGLEKVDVILRRVDDVYCDPLELKEDSQLGVPGLVEAVRCGNVALANPLGSGVLENPGIMPFLPAVSKFFLGQDSLKIPNIASWWCGQPKELNYVLANLDKLVLKRIHRDPNTSTSIDCGHLSQKKLYELSLEVKAKPHLYVGQEKVFFSTLPSLPQKKIEACTALFRAFLVAGKNGGYVAMKGGLTRTSNAPGNIIISNQLGGLSKDTWVLANEPAQQENLGTGQQQQQQQQQSYPLHVAKGLQTRHRHSDYRNILPSHTAENLFWVGRYAERFLGNARFHRTVIQSIIESNWQYEVSMETGHCLLMALTHHTFTYPGFIGENGKAKLASPWKELQSIVFDEKRAGSLYYNFQSFHRAVNSVRDHWGPDTWRAMRNMEEDWASTLTNPASHFKMTALLDDLIASTVTFIGLNRESISREQGWTVMDAGRKIEQGILLANLLRATLVNRHAPQIAYNIQEAVLKSSESLVNYRYKYKEHLQLPLVLELMITDTDNPRSLIYQAIRIKRHFTNIPLPATSQDSGPNHIDLSTELVELLKAADKDALSQIEKNSAIHRHLDTFLSNVYTLFCALPNSISKTYFKHAGPLRQLFTA